MNSSASAWHAFYFNLESFNVICIEECTMDVLCLGWKRV